MELLRHRLIILSAMRIFLLSLMIALLPLRGWVGDVMALERSAPEPQTVMAASVHDDCHETLQHRGHQETSADGDAHAANDCGNCTACQICHSLALAMALLPDPAAQVRMAQPSALAQLHASVDPHPGLRPPIVRA